MVSHTEEVRNIIVVGAGGRETRSAGQKADGGGGAGGGLTVGERQQRVADLGQRLLIV